ncbi:MAG: HAD-IA family hydrolase [Gammaproteobacteria bacterium]|nr:HAD-IA family hydrolase [Gammaproteobacteria bacterium]MCW5583740.1 HAD-IA family hydrolase [Gammaproteobacteria bacterium]
MTSFRAVLFDLDGTLLDTAPDLTLTVNLLRGEYGMPVLPMSAVRPIASYGSKAMIKQAFEIDEHHPTFNLLREKFLAIYEQHLSDSTQFFPNIENVLTHLESNQIPWGIVTNKLTKHTMALLKNLQIDHRPACVVCGDSLPTHKPDPAPIRYACELLRQEPKHCLYVGDAATDVMASKAAGTTSLVALYGYIHTSEEPSTWQADGYVREPIEIIHWLK